ncbi:MAG: hypothetical protein JO295_12075 [Verrucomicrobia bacterium]|nr:hypothetical protein [Verrucomicrobiota bacterium]
MALLEAALILVWTLAAALWWCWAWRLVARQGAVDRVAATGSREKHASVRLTIFKPCPPLGSRQVGAGLIRALESFFGQLDAGCELLLGINAEDRAAWEPLVRRWRVDYPDAAWRVVYRPGLTVSERHANPKVAWQRELAPLASGELWMWSDADIVAPAGFLRAARAEHAAQGDDATSVVLTHPYAVRRAPHPAGLLDALFVNVELLPGVLLLGRRGPDANPKLGLGASLVFPAAEFRRRVDWDDLGACLADDYALARKFHLTRLGVGTLETIAEQTSWRGAALHYLRWQKTVRWCRPAGFLAQLLVFPLLGWLLLLATHWPHTGAAALGAGLTLGMETFFARGICRRAGCAISLRRHWRVLLGWSCLRAAGWLACWLPWPVRWNGRNWWRPRAVPAPRRPAPAVGNVAAGEA